MRVEVDINIEDFRALCKAIWSRARRNRSSPGRRGTLYGLAWIGLVLYYLVVYRAVDGPLGEHFLFGGLLLLPIVAPFVYNYTPHARRKVEPLESGDILGPKSYELTDDGVAQVARYTESSTRWAGVSSVADTPEHLFLFVDRCSAYILPKRCFDSPEHAAEFRAFAEAHVSVAPAS
jgi:hypothetical protein